MKGSIISLSRAVQPRKVLVLSSRGNEGGGRNSRTPLGAFLSRKRSAIWLDLGAGDTCANLCPMGSIAHHVVPEAKMMVSGIFITNHVAPFRGFPRATPTLGVGQ